MNKHLAGNSPCVGAGAIALRIRDDADWPSPARLARKRRAHAASALRA
jgi:hypothetical protein